MLRHSDGHRLPSISATCRSWQPALGASVVHMPAPHTLHACTPWQHPALCMPVSHACSPCSAHLHPTLCTPAPHALHACTVHSAHLHSTPAPHALHACTPRLHPMLCMPAQLSFLHRAGCRGFQPQPCSTAVLSKAPAALAVETLKRVWK